jgi:hypothetical protein
MVGVFEETKTMQIFGSPQICYYLLFAARDETRARRAAWPLARRTYASDTT